MRALGVGGGVSAVEGGGEDINPNNGPTYAIELMMGVHLRMYVGLVFEP